MSRSFYRGIRCHWLYRSGRYCNHLFMDWKDYRKHMHRHRRYDTKAENGESLPKAEGGK